MSGNKRKIHRNINRVQRKKTEKMNVVVDLDISFVDIDMVEYTGAMMLKKAIMPLPYWRLGGLETIDAATEIESALDLDSKALSISPDTRKKLADAMRMENLNVTMTNEAMRFYRKLQRAVLVAEPKKVKKVEEEKAE